MAVILSSPKTFMGAAVIDFNASAGWNSETSNCQINVVEDPKLNQIKFTLNIYILL